MERRLRFDSPTRTRVNSDLCVNYEYCLRLLSVTRSPLSYFSLSQIKLCFAVRSQWLTASDFDRRSHCPGTMPIFTFAKLVSFEHSIGSSQPMITSSSSRREGNINKRAKVSSPALNRRWVRFALLLRELHSLCNLASWRRRDFLAPPAICDMCLGMRMVPVLLSLRNRRRRPCATLRMHAAFMHIYLRRSWPIEAAKKRSFYEL